jgi:hypothetical protein
MTQDHDRVAWRALVLEVLSLRALLLPAMLLVLASCRFPVCLSYPCIYASQLEIV